jgi:hypothetical protein
VCESRVQCNNEDGSSIEDGLHDLVPLSQLRSQAIEQA